ncbi:MAG: cupin domain-containing protein, partial [Chromatiales bacterium]
SSFPLVLNSFNSERFVADNPFGFADRYAGDAAFLSRKDALGGGRYATNFVDDVRRVETEIFDIRGKGSGYQGWAMAGNSMIKLHIADIPPGRYKKAHRHSTDAFILLLSGTGFSVTWPEGFYNKRQRVDWRPGTLFVPPTYWYHQHLNTGTTAARYLAINATYLLQDLGLRFEDQLESDLPEVRAEWQQELAGQQQ